MACDEVNPCDPCSEHDNCGCVNPNTFGCTSYSGTALECLDIANGENGDDILAKIDAKVCDIGKVLIDGDDTCPEFLVDKLSAGTNITLTPVGTGCDRTIRIDAVEGGVPIDINAKVTSNDTTTGYLNSKITTGTYLFKTINNPAGNENLELDVSIESLISADAGNQLIQGDDGGLKTLYTAPDGSETKVIQGVGVIVSGTGTLADPYIVSTNPSIQVVRSCFDSVWRNVTLVATGNASVVYTSGTPQYRYRYDGTLEFRGRATYTVTFGAYSTSNRKFTITIGNIPTTCLTAGEQAGVSDLKGINYIDIPQASADQIVQQYGYIIRKSTNNLIVEFQSSFTGASNAKVIVVNFDGAVSHPLI
jgi:hypothetical protein